MGKIENKQQGGRIKANHIKITTNLNGLNIQIKIEIVILDKKAKTQLYAVYKKSTLNTKTQVG